MPSWRHFIQLEMQEEERMRQHWMRRGIIYGTRERLAELFHAEDASRIAFTANVTESLNIAIQGLFEPGDHVITSVCEHNSVLRPLYLMEQRGVKVTYLPADSKGRITYDELENAYEPETKAVVIMHASNLTGNVTDLEQIAAFTQKHHLLFVVDAAQTAGVLPIDVQKQNIDVLCFTGHKGLFGPQGTGGIYVRKRCGNPAAFRRRNRSPKLQQNTAKRNADSALKREL